MYAYTAMMPLPRREIGAMMSIEIGGMNSVVPFAVAAELGLPVIDGDCMGRAYPEIQLVTLTMYGHKAAPLAVADEHGNVAIVDTIDNFWAERIARPVAVEMGAISGGVGFPVTVGELREAAVWARSRWSSGSARRSVRRRSSTAIRSGRSPRRPAGSGFQRADRRRRRRTRTRVGARRDADRGARRVRRKRDGRPLPERASGGDRKTARSSSRCLT